METQFDGKIYPICYKNKTIYAGLLRLNFVLYSWMDHCVMMWCSVN